MGKKRKGDSIKILSKRRKNELDRQVARDYVAEVKELVSNKLHNEDVSVKQSTVCDLATNAHNPINERNPIFVEENNGAVEETFDNTEQIENINETLESDFESNSGFERENERAENLNISLHDGNNFHQNDLSSDSHDDAFNTNFFLPNNTGEGQEEIRTVTPGKSKIGFKVKFIKWAVKGHIHQVRLKELLEILREQGLDLPKDPRTLLRTSRDTVDVREVHPGVYVHLGLEFGLKKKLKFERNPPRTLKLRFFVDGVPVQGQQFWPILCSVSNIGDKRPFIVGLYSGEKKPDNMNDYLEEFVVEYLVIYEDFTFNDVVYDIIIECIICDAPAKAGILCILNYNGKKGCPKCTILGIWKEEYGKVVFLENNCAPRTDASFRNREDRGHHHQASILQELPIDMVKSIPIDYMHNICSGVVLKIVQILNGKPSYAKLPADKIIIVNQLLQSCYEYFPSEMNRKGALITDNIDWKATESRSFLLYTGPFALKSVLSSDLYDHFMSLSIAIRILCSPKYYLEENDYAKELLDYFFNNYAALYGEVNMVPNVHLCTHLPEDCQRLGPLDTFSGFLYENVNGYISNHLVRAGPKALQQVVKRLSEEEHCDNLFDSRQTFGKMELREFEIKLTNGNNFVFFNDDNSTDKINLAKIVHIDEVKKEFLGLKINNIESFHDEPCDLLDYDIGVGSLDGSSEIHLSLQDIKAKAVVFPRNDDKFVFFPLIHTDL